MGRSRKKPTGEAKLVVRLEAPTAGGVPLALEVADRPLRLAAFVSVARQYGELRLRQAVAREGRRGRAVSCRMGCAACCNQLVPVSGPEALQLAIAFRSLGRARREAVEARIEAVVSQLLASPVATGLRALVAGEATPAEIVELARGYFELGLPCPLLVDERCQLYEHRPLGCMDHVVTTPPELCARAGQGLTQRVATGPQLTWPLVHLVADLTATPPEMLPLPFALGWADVHRELGERSFPARELLDHFFGWIARAERPGG